MEKRLFLSMGLLFLVFFAQSTPVTAQNSPPVANAGPDQNVSVGATVSLNGSGSSDVDGNPLTYSWSLISVPPGSGATLVNPTAVNPTFVADMPGTYVVQLIVNDGLVDSAPDEVVISATGPAPGANPVPTMTEWGMMLLAVILVSLSVFYLRKTRAAA